MFEVGDLVSYKNVTGKVVFSCEHAISILVGDELPKATQTRLVVYNHSWSDVNLIGDTK